MSILVDTLADSVRDSVDSADATREDWQGALRQVYGSEERHAVLLENIVVGFTCPECEHEETAGLDSLVIVGAPMCPECGLYLNADTTADILPA